MRKSVIILILLLSIGSMVFATAARQSPSSGTGPVNLTIFYSDNPTLPFRQDWLTIRKAEELFNVRVNWEVIPLADFQTRVSLALNTGINTPDVITVQSMGGDNLALAQNGAIVPISDYSTWTPNFNARVSEYGLRADVDREKLRDGKLYYLPALYDAPFYDAGLILREDLLARYNMRAPTTFDELGNFLRAYKRDNPASYPLTVTIGPRVLYRFTQPAWGFTLHRSAPGGGRVLSWDYDRNTFFAAATSDQYREYLRYFNRWYTEGLLDPEMADPVNGDIMNRKMATGSAIATYAWYDQIGGMASASTIQAFRLNMYPPLAGPAGAHTWHKDRVGAGILFPIAVSRRADFENVIRAVDNMFYSKEAELLWCLGVEGETYTMQGGTHRFIDSIVNSADGTYKTMQIRYGCGTATLQYIWNNAREMTKYDANYARINQAVAAMPGAMQSVWPTPRYRNPVDAERAASLQGTLYDAWLVWDNDFLTGARSLDTDWAAYVADMNSKGLNELLQLFNNNL
jgi:putative aldouronate transport system substrate-binding protein